MPNSAVRRHGPPRKANTTCFTRDDCRKGYKAALDNCMEDWNLYAWFTYKIRGWYRKRKREDEEDPF